MLKFEKHAKKAPRIIAREKSKIMFFDCHTYNVNPKPPHRRVDSP